MEPSDLDLEQLRRAHSVAARAWRFAWSARLEWHATTFPATDEEPGLVYEHVIEECEVLRAAEERAYDRFLAARQVLLEAVRSSPGGHESGHDLAR